MFCRPLKRAMGEKASATPSLTTGATIWRPLKRAAGDSGTFERGRGRPRYSRSTTPRTRTYPHPSEQGSLAGGSGLERPRKNFLLQLKPSLSG
jgi:hypothetical protein